MIRILFAAALLATLVTPARAASPRPEWVADARCRSRQGIGGTDGVRS